MCRKMTKNADGIKAAKRRMDYDAFEINRLGDLVMKKTEECNEKDKKIYQFAKESMDFKRGWSFEEAKRNNMVATLEKQLTAERTRNNTLEEELLNTLQRLHAYTIAMLLPCYLFLLILILFNFIIISLF